MNKSLIKNGLLGIAIGAAGPISYGLNNNYFSKATQETQEEIHAEIMSKFAKFDNEKLAQSDRAYFDALIKEAESSESFINRELKIHECLGDILPCTTHNPEGESIQGNILEKDRSASDFEIKIDCNPVENLDCNIETVEYIEE